MAKRIAHSVQDQHVPVCVKQTRRASVMPSCSRLAPRSFPALWGANSTSASSGGDNRSSALHVFSDAWASADGLIVKRDDCTAVRNGGCAHHMHKSWAPPAQGRSYKRVVTLAMHYGDAHYHFPIEVLAGVAFSHLPPPSPSFSGACWLSQRSLLQQLTHLMREQMTISQRPPS